MFLSTFAPEMEMYLSSCHFDMAATQGGQSIRVVLAHIFLVPHANERGIEQAHNRRQHFYIGQARQRKVARNSLADSWKRLTKGDHAIILGLVAHLSPARMIAVLFAPFGIPPGCLKVSFRRRAYPHIFPCRRYADFLNAFQLSRVMNRLAIQSHIAEVFPHALAPYPRLSIAHITQASSFCRFSGISSATCF